jgi:GNAT superfamily N-acetyltransferase
MNLRDADDTEVDELAQLWHDGWRDAHLAIVPAELARIRTLESFRQRMRADLSNVRVAGAKGGALGFAMLKGDELYQFYVAAPARGTGVAAALMADAEARLAERGVEIAWLACASGNDRAARFYEKCGWRRGRKVVSLLETAEGPLSLEVWRYEKRVAPG